MLSLKKYKGIQDWQRNNSYYSRVVTCHHSFYSTNESQPGITTVLSAPLRNFSNAMNLSGVLPSHSFHLSTLIHLHSSANTILLFSLKCHLIFVENKSHFFYTNNKHFKLFIYIFATTGTRCLSKNDIVNINISTHIYHKNDKEIITTIGDVIHLIAGLISGMPRR